MARLNTYRFAAIFLILIALPAQVLAWSHNPAENDHVADSPNNVGRLQAFPNGSGGYTAVWLDADLFLNWEVFAIGIDPYGAPAWGPIGTPMMTMTSDDIYMDAAVDSAGNVFIAREGMTDGVNLEIHVQKIQPNGNLPWGNGGILVASYQGLNLPHIAPDNQGGCVVVWSEDQGGPSDMNIYGQRLNANGIKLWRSTGLTLCGANEVQLEPVIEPVSDGFIVGWADFRNQAGKDIYADKFDWDGVSQWTEDGMTICDQPGNQSGLTIVPESTGGAVFVWLDHRNLNWDVYITTVLGSGIVPGPYDGIPVCEESGDQLQAEAVSDGASGVYVVWRDNRTSDAYQDITLYAQHMFVIGGASWTPGGVAVSPGSGQDDQALWVDSSGRLGVVWTDSRFANNDLYTQILTPDGTPQLNSSGVVVSNALGNQARPVLLPGTDNSMIAIFENFQTYTNEQICLQRIDTYGYLGDPTPVMVSADDIPGDQGGQVLLAWDRSYLDDMSQDGLQHYAVWDRFNDAKLSRSWSPVEIAQLADRSGLPEADVAAWLKSGWSYLGDVPAQYFSSYGFLATTLVDSTSAGNPATEYRVVALGNNGEVWHSNVVSGYSVDNLAPEPPLALVAASNGPDVDLEWSVGEAPPADLAEYFVYRSAVSGFTPGPGTFIGSTPETFHTDLAPPAGTQYYLVTAVDIHGNEGSPSNEAFISNASGVAEDGLSSVFSISPATPNPFNPSTKIALSLPKAGLATIKVYDSRGSLVRVLHQGYLPNGRHELSWHGRDDSGRAMSSGVYLLRASSGGITVSKKLVLAK